MYLGVRIHFVAGGREEVVIHNARSIYPLTLVHAQNYAIPRNKTSIKRKLFVYLRKTSQRGHRHAFPSRYIFPSNLLRRK